MSSESSEARVSPTRARGKTYSLEEGCSDLCEVVLVTVEIEIEASLPENEPQVSAG